MACKRSMDCTCPECVAAAAAFSVEDLKQFSSTIDYGEEGADGANPPEPLSTVKPLAKPVPKRKPRARPAAAASAPQSCEFDLVYSECFQFCGMFP